MATITGTTGNDDLFGGNTDDSFVGLGGDDTITDSGGNNTVDSGDGNDSISVSSGDDSISAGAGDDNINAGSGADLVYGGDGADSVLAGSGDDVVYGGAGNDSIAGEGAKDTIYGGDGADTIDGGSDDDTVYGGAGDDSLTGGDGNDILFGGAGNDIITAGNGVNTIVFGTGDGADTITDFDKVKDTIELRFYGVADYSDVTPLMADDGPDTVITFDDGSTMRLNGVNTGDLSASNFTFTPDPVCYAPGTLILTERGERPVEDLCVGDMLVTADRGLRPIRWIGRTEHRFPAGPHKHKPIEIKAGSLGGGLPRRTLIVSPQHHMLMGGPVVYELFGEVEVLALAKALVGLDHIRAMNGKREVTYYSLLCDRHEVIMAEGAWSESFYPGPTALKMIGPSMRRQVEALFPALRTNPRTGYGPKVRRSLTRKETEDMVDKLLARGFGREDDEIARWKREAGFREWDRDLADEQRAVQKQWDHLRVVE